MTGLKVTFRSTIPTQFICKRASKALVAGEEVTQGTGSSCAQTCTRRSCNAKHTGCSFKGVILLEGWGVCAS